jgi:ketosteroid isomerase-like protein
MKTLKNTSTLVGISIALAVIATASLGADPSAEVAAIHAVDQVWVKAYNAGDVDTVVSLYAEHAILLPPGVPSANGRTAIRAFFVKDIAAATKDGFNFILGDKPGGGVSGDLGWASGTYIVKDKAGNPVDSGKYLSVSKKIDGKWLYIRDAWNSDGAPASVGSAVPPRK